jgi:hypothetical protein
VTLSFKRDLKQYTNANQEITGSDNSPGWKCAIGKIQELGHPNK